MLEAPVAPSYVVMSDDRLLSALRSGVSSLMNGDATHDLYTTVVNTWTGAVNNIRARGKIVEKYGGPRETRRAIVQHIRQRDSGLIGEGRRIRSSRSLVSSLYAIGKERYEEKARSRARRIILEKCPDASIPPGVANELDSPMLEASLQVTMEPQAVVHVEEEVTDVTQVNTLIATEGEVDYDCDEEVVVRARDLINRADSERKLNVYLKRIQERELAIRSGDVVVQNREKSVSFLRSLSTTMTCMFVLEAKRVPSVDQLKKEAIELGIAQAKKQRYREKQVEFEMKIISGEYRKYSSTKHRFMNEIKLTEFDIQNISHQQEGLIADDLRIMSLEEAYVNLEATKLAAEGDIESSNSLRTYFDQVLAVRRSKRAELDALVQVKKTSTLSSTNDNNLNASVSTIAISSNEKRMARILSELELQAAITSYRILGLEQHSIEVELNKLQGNVDVDILNRILRSNNKVTWAIGAFFANTNIELYSIEELKLIYQSVTTKISPDDKKVVALFFKSIIDLNGLSRYPASYDYVPRKTEKKDLDLAALGDFAKFHEDVAEINNSRLSEIFDRLAKSILSSDIRALDEIESEIYILERGRGGLNQPNQQSIMIMNRMYNIARPMIINSLLAKSKVSEHEYRIAGVSVTPKVEGLPSNTLELIIQADDPRFVLEFYVECGSVFMSGITNKIDNLPSDGTQLVRALKKKNASPRDLFIIATLVEIVRGKRNLARRELAAGGGTTVLTDTGSGLVQKSFEKADDKYGSEEIKYASYLLARQDNFRRSGGAVSNLFGHLRDRGIDRAANITRYHGQLLLQKDTQLFNL